MYARTCHPFQTAKNCCANPITAETERNSRRSSDQSDPKLTRLHSVSRITSDLSSFVQNNSIARVDPWWCSFLASSTASRFKKNLIQLTNHYNIEILQTIILKWPANSLENRTTLNSHLENVSCSNIHESVYENIIHKGLAWNIKYFAWTPLAGLAKNYNLKLLNLLTYSNQNLHCLFYKKILQLWNQVRL